MIKNYAKKIFADWINADWELTVQLAEKNPSAKFLDLGCGDGILTKQVADKIGTKNISVMDWLKPDIKGVKYFTGDFNKPLPFKDNSFDVILSHYSIEHLYNTGLFISECYRILKKGGYIIVTTDNMSAWANVASLIMGWQPFTTTMGVGKRALGNPMALRAGDFLGGGAEIENLEAWRLAGEYSHNKVLAYQMLHDAFVEYGFQIDKIYGVGYPPFYGRLSKFFCSLDPRHAHLLVMKAWKK